MEKLGVMVKVILNPPPDVDYFSVGMVKNFRDFSGISRHRFKQDIADL
jgi:hypothetical protein